MKVAIVTGGGRGLGRAFAGALAKDGWTIAAMARSAAELDETVAQVEQAGGMIQAWTVDVTDRGAVHDAFSDVERVFGPADLLVNNAGVPGPLGPFALNGLDEWWRTIEIDLLGQVICAHRVVSGMIARKTGRIVNIASGGGTYMLPNLSAYVTAKTALVRFSECLAAEVRDQGISVFAMSPGTVRTAMSEYSLYSSEARKWIPWFREIFDQGRDLPPERPATLLVTLASGKADTLSGCMLQPQDDLEHMIAMANRIEELRLYRLQLPRL